MLKQIGKFTLLERVGRGTYSHVYRAEDPQGRSFAIKISTTPSEPHHLAEFQKDLVAAASVLHPSLVSVQDLGFDDSFPYVLMEFVEGRDLSQIIKNHASVPLGERDQQRRDQRTHWRFASSSCLPLASSRSSDRAQAVVSASTSPDSRRRRGEWFAAPASRPRSRWARRPTSSWSLRSDGRSPARRRRRRELCRPWSGRSVRPPSITRT